MTRECTESGWSGTLASCERVDCGDPGSVSNGGRTLVSTLFSSRVRYFCSRGYVLDGNVERTCGADGEWSGNTPSCVGEQIGSVKLLILPSSHTHCTC